MSHSERRRRRHRPANDAGVMAIIVALSVSTFVLGFAALAVDLGAAYARKADLQSIANRLTLAGAKGLPTIVEPEGALDQINRALTQICIDQPTPGVCVIAGDGTGTAPDITWATDGDPDNGEVTFFADADGDGKYGLGDQVGSLASSSQATALQVKVAPSKVEFGLAAAIGYDSATLTKSASGRVGTPLGAGILPFALNQQDLDAGQFCVRDPSVPGLPTAPDPAPEFYPIRLSFPTDPPVDGDTQFPGGVPNETDDLTMLIELAPVDPRSIDSVALSAITFHFTTTRQAAPDPELVEPGIYRVPLPRGAPGDHPQVWATGTQTSDEFTGPFTSDTGDIIYTGEAPPGSDLCTQPAANRGFVQLARPGGGAVLASLEQNVRSGPAVKLSPAGGLLGSLGAGLNCVSLAFSPASTCLSTTTGQTFRGSLSRGLLRRSGNSPGRLIGDCGNGTTSSAGRGGVDASRLFRDDGFIDTSKGGNGTTLRDRLNGASGSTAALPANRGWITSKVLRCPRLAVLPVIDPGSVVPGVAGGRTITKFTYVWIDDDVTPANRGLTWSGGRLQSVRGYVVDPGYLPPVVSGSKLIGPYLGDGMPKEVALVPDLGRPPT